jgi:hypothetical protein
VVTTDPPVSSESPQSDLASGLRIHLSRNWDSFLSYEVLEDSGDRRRSDADTPVFVGRTDLLGPLVMAMSQPDRRGTYLVSGYRGAGKTSLVIEAARQAGDRLESLSPPWTLLPLVLNVSEVSASLNDASEREDQPLKISARRLLTSLLRAIRNSRPIKDAEREATAETTAKPRRRRQHDDEPVVEDQRVALMNQVVDACSKAEASTYELKQLRRADETATRASETKRAVEVADLLKLVAVVAAVGAVALEGLFLAQHALLALQAIVVALAGTAVFSFHRWRTTTETSTRQNTAELQIAFDNSLQQLESDLRNILQGLAEQRWRTIIVLEELDKVADDEGAQLDAVIRYFKNLFTQAPAVFLFLTDKGYFDLIEERIDGARRRRSYAIEHTFFTHRLFVGRPPASDCLRYLHEVMTDETARAAIDTIVKTDGNRLRRLDEMDLTERFLRVALFRAQDHLFDLKNELRRYVVVEDGSTWLVCDERSFPDSEQATAMFQFLLEQKARSFRFGGASDYHNEILRSCLSVVFSDLGSPGEQTVATFQPMLPEPSVERSPDPAPPLGPPGDQLTRDEREKISNAVSSLVDELHRGGAIEPMDVPNTPTATDASIGVFRWLPTAAQSFRPVARLEDYESALVDRLQQLSRIVSQVGSGGVLRGDTAEAASADVMAERFAADAARVPESGVQMTNEEALQRQRAAEREARELIDRTTDRHAERISRALALQPLSKARRGVWVVPPEPGVLAMANQRADAKAPGEPDSLVVLAYGSDELTTGAVHRLASSPDTNVTKAAIVVVEPDPVARIPHDYVFDLWQQTLADTPLADRSVIIGVPLHEELDPGSVEGTWGLRTVDALLYASCWTYQDRWVADQDGTRPDQRRYILLSSDGDEQKFTDIEAATTAWRQIDDAELVSTGEPGLELHDLQRAAVRTGTPTQPVVVLPPAPGVPPDVVDRLKALIASCITGARISLFGSGMPNAAGTDIKHALTKYDKNKSYVGTSTLRASDDPVALRRLAQLLRGDDVASPQASRLLTVAADADYAPAIADLILARQSKGSSELVDLVKRLERLGDRDEIERVATLIPALGPDDAEFHDALVHAAHSVGVAREEPTEAAHGGGADPAPAQLPERQQPAPTQSTTTELSSTTEPTPES